MSKIDLKIKSRDLNALLAAIRANNPEGDLDLIRRAYEYASEAHKNQTRLSGEPYIIHPLEIGIILANLKMDTTTIAAALLHDVVEDTPVSLEIVREMQSHARAASTLTVPRYIDWVVSNVRRFEEVDLEVGGTTDEERASSLVSEMIRVGLAARV